jgi:hypothetical protein
VAHTVSHRPPTAAARILARTGPFAIRCRQVAMVRFSFNAPALPVNTLPPTLPIHALLSILFAVKSHRFTSYLKETFLCVSIKNDSDGLGRVGGCLLAEKVPVCYSI